MSKFVWTNHALERLKERKVPDYFADQTMLHPDNVFAEGDTTKYRKRFGHQTTTAVVRRNEKGENIVISFWVDPPNFGTADFRKKQNYIEMKKSKGIKKIWLIIRKQLGF